MSAKTVRQIMFWGGLVLTVLQVLVGLDLPGEWDKYLIGATSLLAGLGVRATALTGMVDAQDVKDPEPKNS